MCTHRCSRSWPRYGRVQESNADEWATLRKKPSIGCTHTIARSRSWLSMEARWLWPSPPRSSVRSLALIAPSFNAQRLRAAARRTVCGGNSRERSARRTQIHTRPIEREKASPTVRDGSALYQLLKVVKRARKSLPAVRPDAVDSVAVRSAVFSAGSEHAISYWERTTKTGVDRGRRPCDHRRLWSRASPYRGKRLARCAHPRGRGSRR